VTSIREWAFNSCYGLTSVTIPSSVTSIEAYVFFYCRGLTSVTIPNSVTSIGRWAFFGCNITSVTIGNSVENIESEAFADCRITSVTNLNPEPQSIDFDVFWVGIGDATLYVPAESVDAYKAAPVWQGFKTIEAYVLSSIDAPANTNAVRIYPNPVCDELFIQSAQPVENVIIYNLAGVQMENCQWLNGKSINVSALPAGVYFVKAGNYTGKFVKE
jgi:hypothetical protein